MEYVPSSSFVAEILPFLIAVWMTLLDLPVACAACPMLYMVGFCGVLYRSVAVLENGSTERAAVERLAVQLSTCLCWSRCADPAEAGRFCDFRGKEWPVRSDGQGKAFGLSGLSTARKIGLLSISAGTGAGLLRWRLRPLLRRPVQLRGRSAGAGPLRLPLQFQL